MAKKRSKKKSGGSKKRRRVSGLNLKGGTGLKLLAVAGGFLLGDQVNTAISGVVDKIMPQKNPDGTTNTAPNRTIQTVAQVGIGGLLLLKKKGMLPTVVGGVLAGAGLKMGLKQMGVIKGYQNVPVIGRRRLAGYQNVPVIGSNGIPAQLAGSAVPGQLQGFRVNGGFGTNGYGSQGSGVMGTVINPYAGGAGGSGINTGSGYMN